MYLSYPFQHRRCVLMEFASKDAMDRVRLIDCQRMDALVSLLSKRRSCSCYPRVSRRIAVFGGYSHAMLLIVIRTLSHHHDHLRFSNVPRAYQQYCGEPLSGGGSQRQKAAPCGTNSVQKVHGSVIRCIQSKHRECDGNCSAGHCFCFRLSTAGGILSLDSYYVSYVFLSASVPMFLCS